MNKETSFRIPATTAAIEEGLDRVAEALESLNADHKTCYKVRLALDELLTNVVSYAYEGKEGEVEIRYETQDDPRSITIVIIDEGKEFNPLETEDPDLLSEIGERKIGGLGLFIVKSTMDEIAYRREDNKNILTVKKNI